MIESGRLESPEATVTAGAALAVAMRELGLDELVVYLVGDLGAGKTTFARGFLEGWGYSGRVPSPTYTLVEPYTFESVDIYHIDLYRLTDPADADHLGLAELPGTGVVMLVEWPERAAGRLPAADLNVVLQVVAAERRAIDFEARSTRGRRLLTHKST